MTQVPARAPQTTFTISDKAGAATAPVAKPAIALKLELTVDRDAIDQTLRTAMNEVPHVVQRCVPAATTLAPVLAKAGADLITSVLPHVSAEAQKIVAEGIVAKLPDLKKLGVQTAEKMLDSVAERPGLLGIAARTARFGAGVLLSSKPR